MTKKYTLRPPDAPDTGAYTLPVDFVAVRVLLRLAIERTQEIEQPLPDDIARVDLHDHWATGNPTPGRRMAARWGWSPNRAGRFIAQESERVRSIQQARMMNDKYAGPPRPDPSPTVETIH